MDTQEIKQLAGVKETTKKNKLRSSDTNTFKSK